MRTSAIATAALLAAGLLQAISLARDLQVSTSSALWMALFAAWSALLLVCLSAVYGFYRPAGKRLAARLEHAFRRIRLPRTFAGLLFILPAILIASLLLTPLPRPINLLLALISVRLLLFWLLALAGAAGLHTLKPDSPFPENLALTALLYGALLRAAAFLPDISTYPFSLGWSEASRYYYASLFLSQKVYGVSANPSVLHPTRYLMQSIPFLLEGLPLWVHRAWQVMLWLGANGLTAWLLVYRLRDRLAGRALILGLWAFLFLFQGPVWYHLVLMVGLVLLGVETDRFWRTFWVVAAVSVWAGISRVNWIPFPAALAATLYLLEVPAAGKPPRRYLAPPFIWGVSGIGFGLAAQAAYAVLSGNALEQFASSFTSDLLWYRLLPSSTYPLGVLPGILLVSLPVFTAVTQRLGWRLKTLGPLRAAGILGILLVFFGGGLVVSAKIGGGSNLHNLDGYISLLMVFGVYAVFKLEPTTGRLRPWVIALAVAIPLILLLGNIAPSDSFDDVRAQEDLVELTGVVEDAAAEGGEVLFIAERHLLAFGALESVGLVEEYEKVFLMEMAMADNRTYLDRFERDLAGTRFALIVTDVVNFNIQTRADEFGEENNAWNLNVSYPLLCFYEVIGNLDSPNVDILAPKASPGCPNLPDGVERGSVPGID